MSDDPKIVDLAEARARKAATLKREERAKKRETDEEHAQHGWDVGYSVCGHVLLGLDFELDGEEWELTGLALKPARARALASALYSYASAAEDLAERNAGVVDLIWASTRGAPAHGDSVRAVIVGRVPGAVLVEPSKPEDHPVGYWVAGKFQRTPRHGWPTRGLYSLADGGPVDRDPRKRHWRICESHLAHLREKALP